MSRNLKFILIIPVIAFAVMNLNCPPRDEIDECLITFNGTQDLKISSTERLPESSEKFRSFNTDSGEVRVSRTDGYKILYKNSKGAEMLDLKVELSEEDSYKTDKELILDNLKFLISHSDDLTSPEPIAIEKNGYKIYGLNRDNIDNPSSTLGIYIMSPGKNITVYFYFNNLHNDSRSYNNLDEFMAIRDRFLDEYTKYIKECKD